MPDKLTLQEIAKLPIRDALLHLALMEDDGAESGESGMPGVADLVTTVMGTRAIEPSLIPAACLMIN